MTRQAFVVLTSWSASLYLRELDCSHQHRIMTAISPMTEGGSFTPASSARSTARTEFLSLLDAMLPRVRAHDLREMDTFVVALDRLRRRISPLDWTSLVNDVATRHPLPPLLREEPLCARAFAKPRGYAGDAVMMDMIYGIAPADFDVSAVTPLGQLLQPWAETHHGAVSVRERRGILARAIDDAAATHGNPRVLAIAAGHLREAQQSEAIRAGSVEELVALDQDAASVALIDREQSRHGVTAVQASVRRLLARPTAYGTFDFAYSAGLYDYLAEPVARRLTSATFSALRPGGRLLVGNFAPNLRDIAYMEAISDWHLIYRDEFHMARLILDIPEDAIAERRMFRDSADNVVYLSLTKL